MTARGYFIAGVMSLLSMSSVMAADKVVYPQDDAEFPTYILLDRTGSMKSMWSEAVGSVNIYARSVAEGDEGAAELDPTITLAVFDKNNGRMQFDVVRDGVQADRWKPLSHHEISPRGNTPLFDAIGELVAIAAPHPAERGVLVIMTDGEENASHKHNADTAKAALDVMRAKGWDVVFLGAEFVNFADAEAVGISAGKSIAVQKESLENTMRAIGKKNRAYGLKQSDSVTFEAEDRAIAGEEALKLRKGAQ